MTSAIPDTAKANLYSACALTRVNTKASLCPQYMHTKASPCSVLHTPKHKGPPPCTTARPYPYASSTRSSTPRPRLPSKRGTDCHSVFEKRVTTGDPVNVGQLACARTTLGTTQDHTGLDSPLPLRYLAPVQRFTYILGRRNRLDDCDQLTGSILCYSWGTPSCLANKL